MRQVSTGANLRRVRLGQPRGRCNSGDSDHSEARLNLLAIEFLSQPVRLFRGIPRSERGGIPALFLGLAGAGFRAVRNHSPQPCGLYQPLP